MARPKLEDTTTHSKKELTTNKDLSDDFTKDLIKQINKEHGSQVAFNLSTDDAPTNISKWISTGSKFLDAIISNRGTVGGLPTGRIVEIQGNPASGKTHIAYEVAKATQKEGGIVVYIDSENATSLDTLKDIGIDISKRFIFVQSGCTEETFSIVESTITKARAMTKDVPVTVIIDSVSQLSPKAELDGDMDQNTIGLQARVLGKAMRKIANMIGDQKVLLLLVSQLRMKIGVMYGDNTTTSGGLAIPYASSLRLRVNDGSPIKDKAGNIIGKSTTVKTIKNKVGKPFREANIDIIFGRGINDHEHLFDLFRSYCEKSKTGVKVGKETCSVEGTGAWKTFSVFDEHGVQKVEEKFYKNEFGKYLNDPKYTKYFDAILNEALIIKNEDDVDKHSTFTGTDDMSVDDKKALGE